MSIVIPAIVMGFKQESEVLCACGHAENDHSIPVSGNGGICWDCRDGVCPCPKFRPAKRESK